MDGCIFCKIIKKEIPAKIVFESKTIIVFPDINPSAPIHLLIVPKEHIIGIEAISAQNADLLAEVYQVANQLVLENNLQDSSYKVVVNGGKAQHVPHLHFHLLGGKLQKMV